MSLQPPIDYAFTTNASIEAGLWNMNLDGSTSEMVFSIKSPLYADFVVKGAKGTMLSSTDMDDAKFGGITALTNGIILRAKNPVSNFTWQFALIVNNTGFYENGFETLYTSKAPAGSYGFKFRQNLDQTNAVVLKLQENLQAQLIVRDDLIRLSQFTMSVMGHLIY